jgi:hypothetical protein
MVESRSSATTVRWALWSHDQMLGETILIATRISNSTAAQYLSMIGRPSMRSLLRELIGPLRYGARSLSGLRKDFGSPAGARPGPYPFCSVPRAAAAIKKGNTMQRISNETLRTSTI